MDSFMRSDDKIPLARRLWLWGGSFVLIANLLFFYLGVPLVPVLLAGAATLGLTLFRHRRKPK